MTTTKTEEELHEEMWEESKPYGKGPLIGLKMLADVNTEAGHDVEKVRKCLEEFPKALIEIERLQELSKLAILVERDAIIATLSHHMNHNTRYGDEVNLINHLIGMIKNRDKSR